MSTQWINGGSGITPQELIGLVRGKMGSNLRASLEIMAEEVKDIIKEKVNAWYNSRTPTDYVQRTYQVLESITVGEIEQVGKYYQVEVYFDGDKLTENMNPLNGGWISHKATMGKNAKYQRIHFWDMMENGWHLPNKSRDFEGHKAIEEIRIWNEAGKFVKSLQIVLESKGYMITKR